MGHKNPDIEINPDHEHIWSWFWQLNEARTHGMNGPNPLTYSEIASWVSLSGEIVSREEIAVIRKMDAAFIKALSEERKAQDERNKVK